MLYQDTLTGYLYEVPDRQPHPRYRVINDGLEGSPGLGIAPAVAAAVAPIAIRAVGSLLHRRRRKPDISKLLSTVANRLQQLLQRLPASG